MKRQFSLALASFLSVLMAFMPTMTTTNAQANSMNAATPITTIVSIDSTFINDFDCAFPLGNESMVL